MSALGVNRHVRDSASWSMADPPGVDRTGCLRLDRNESTRPVSGTVAAALSDHLSGAGFRWYPSDERLTARIAEHCGVPAESVLVTNGSDQAIDITLRTFLQPGSRMLVATPEFIPFRRVAGLLGAQVEGVPYEPDFTFPYARFRAAAQRKPALIVFINPNNPTGTLVDPEFIREILAEHPDIPVIVDEAYYEFTGVTVAPWVKRYRNLIVFRTFSKAFAMAGLRLGYAVAAPAVVEQIRKLRNPFDVNELAIVAGEAQLATVDEVDGHTEEIMSKVKPMVLEFFRDLGVPVVPGAANFLLVRPEDCAGTVLLLRESRVLVQPLHGPLVGGMFRLTVGQRQEMEEFARIFTQVHRETGGRTGPRTPSDLLTGAEPDGT
ncbi:histidinol-phosphate transaminase [Streptomyces ossamyceticus]|nr:histidinol-phosphate transaminase [Streptomyces ossamyceticus]